MHSKSKGPKRLSAYFSEKSKINQLIETQKQYAHLLGTIQSCLPEPLDQHCHGAVIGKNGLILYTESSLWASRLRFFSRQLNLKLHENGLVFPKINIRVMIQEQQKKQRYRARAAPISEANGRGLLELAKHVDNATLSRALRKLGKGADNS